MEGYILENCELDKKTQFSKITKKTQLFMGQKWHLHTFTPHKQVFIHSTTLTNQDKPYVMLNLRYIKAKCISLTLKCII